MLESPEVRESYLSLLQALKRAEVPVHDLKDDLKRGGQSVVELMRRMTTASEDILAHCVARGMNPGCSDRKLIVVVFEILREFEGYRSPLSVDHYLKPGQFLKGKFNVLQKFARYLRVVKDKDLSHAESEMRHHKRLSELTKDTESSRAHRGEALKAATEAATLFTMAEETATDERAATTSEDETMMAYAQTSFLKSLPSAEAPVQQIQENKHPVAAPSRRVTHTGAMNSSALDLADFRSPLESTDKGPPADEGGTEDKVVSEGGDGGDGGVMTGRMLQDMEKQFADSQSMMRMILSLSKRIRSLEDYGGSLDGAVQNTPSLLHTAPHKQAAARSGGDSSKSTPTRGMHASPGRTSSYRNSIAGGSAAGTPGKKVSLGDTLYGGEDGAAAGDTADGPPLPHGQQQGQPEGSRSSRGAVGGTNTNEELGTAYIDLLFSLLEKKMRANFHEETQAAVNSAVAASEKRNAEQMKTLVSEIDKIHGNFDHRLAKLETTLARDKMEKRMEEQEMGKLIANSAYSPTSNIARFRMANMLSGATTSTSGGAGGR